jgi:hypothetical protein
VIEAQGTSPMLGWLLSMNVIEEEKNHVWRNQNACEDMKIPFDDGLDGYLDARIHVRPVS